MGLIEILNILPSMVGKLFLEFLRERQRAGMTIADLIDQAEAQVRANEKKAEELLKRLNVGQ